MSHDLFEINMNNRTSMRAQAHAIQNGTLKERFFSARLMEPLIELHVDDETVQISYDHAVKLQCSIKIGKSDKIILFRTLWATDFYVELCVV